MEDMGLVNTFEGNLSIKDGDLLYITPGRTSKKKLTHDNICVFDESTGEKLWGGRPSSETKMHRGAYTVKEGLHGVIHCHAPYLTAHAVTHVPLDFKCHPELLFHLRIFRWLLTECLDQMKLLRMQGPICFTETWC